MTKTKAVTGLEAAIKLAAKNNPAIDARKSAHVLTDKPETKIVGCRECKRPCVVTQFAAPAKVACNDCRERRADPAKIHEFDESKDEHVLTDKEQTKRVPCAVCGRPCIVTTFAAPEKVRCLDHRSIKPRKTTTVEKLDNGRYAETTKVEFANEQDVAWSKWILTMPWIDPEWTEDELALRDKLQADQIQALHDHAKAKADRLKAEAASLKAKADDKKVEAALSDADKREVAAANQAKVLRKERDLLYRRAYRRTLEDQGYEFKGTELWRGSEHITTAPSDWMEG